MLETRKLAVIAFADIAGYSAMMQEDEKKALHTLDQFKSILELEMHLHDGEIVQYYGDGCLLSFNSAFHAVQAMASLQQTFLGQEIPVRIGMHIGDVVYKNNNLFGDGVNIASRIESLGVPGSILLSKSIQNELKNKAEYSLVSLGHFHFKNISEPMEVFGLANPGYAIPKAGQIQGKLAPSSPQPPPPEDQAEWEKYQMLEIMDALEEEKCVLILGNYAFSRPSSTDIAAESEVFLPDLLAAEQRKWARDMPPEKGQDFFSLAQSLVGRAGGQRMFMKLSNIQLEDLGPRQKDRFRQISEIPFDLVLSTYPFDLLHEVFEDNRIDHSYGYFSYLQDSGTLEPFSATKPLIYNLFGSTKHKESMVISLDRLYQFLFGVLGVRQLPKLIQDKVQQASHLVFLGFSFDDWYMKLLLRVLKVHEKDISYAHPPGATGLRQYNRKFFESNFKVSFLDKHIDEFVSGLYSHCQEAGILRKKSPSSDKSPFDMIRELIVQNRLTEALDKLDDLIIQDGKESQLMRELGELQWTYHKIRKWEQYESFSQEEMEGKWKEFIQTLFLFVDEVKTHIPEKTPH